MFKFGREAAYRRIGGEKLFFKTQFRYNNFICSQNSTQAAL